MADSHADSPKNSIESAGNIESETAQRFLTEFETFRSQARQSLQFAQVAQHRNYNQGRLYMEFDAGDQVLINPHSLKLLRADARKGKKLTMRYEGPFEILQKMGPNTYRLRMPASYGIHPVLNLVHLEPYTPSDPALGSRPFKETSREDFNALPEFEVDSIIVERWRRARNGRRIQELLTKFTSYDSTYDEWLTRKQLKNAPDRLREWDCRNKGMSRH